ncbi:MAG: EamA family transporter [Candidatus Wallbacteria bacterium]|nr:EamA family transporter [Candidatus Wallbacteria bacterium]
MTIPAKASSARIALAMAILYFVWGSTYLAIRVGVGAIPPAMFAGLRFLVAGVSLALISWGRREAMPRRAAEWATAALVGCVLLVFGNGLVCWAEQTVASGLTALIICTTPLWLMSMESLVPGGERLGLAEVAWLCLGLVGIAILVSPQLTAGHSSSAGVAALIVAAMSWSLGSTIGRHGTMPSSVLVASAIEMLAGGIGLLGVAGLRGEWTAFDAARVPLASWLAWAYLVTFGSLLAFSAYSWLLVNARPTVVVTYAYVNPVVAVLLGVLVLKEPVGPTTLLGAAVTLGAVIAVTQRRSRPAPPARHLAGGAGPEPRQSSEACPDAAP